MEENPTPENGSRSFPKPLPTPKIEAQVSPNLLPTPKIEADAVLPFAAVFQLNPADNHCLVCHGEPCIASSAVEMVKAGESLKVQPELGKVIHISQAALGEVKDVKGAKRIPIRMKIDTNKYVIGTLSAEDRPQVMFDLVFEREFELSHDWKNGSVYCIGYIADDQIQEVVVEIEMQLNKKDVEEVNRRTGGNAGADKHTNIATALLGEIKERSMDSYAKMESEMMIRGGIDKNELLSMLRGKGDKMDKLRFAIMHLISTESLYPSEVEMVEVAPRESDVDASAFQKEMDQIKGLWILKDDELLQRLVDKHGPRNRSLISNVS
ncbi:unnamed protein product [Fraxinus pennsylvanica]|uniref:Nucleoplasmin-like domain-containing protein n=1 Tax=Fraxinus pennsylvanica TaxID=56036 RepID=A0AAD2ECP4_9LAMI|nr:unnamed protein product [Fraxinus pennsylvanica]